MTPANTLTKSSLEEKKEKGGNGIYAQSPSQMEVEPAEIKRLPLTAEQVKVFKDGGIATTDLVKN